MTEKELVALLKQGDFVRRVMEGLNSPYAIGVTEASKGKDSILQVRVTEPLGTYRKTVHYGTARVDVIVEGCWQPPITRRSLRVE